MNFYFSYRPDDAGEYYCKVTQARKNGSIKEERLDFRINVIASI